MQIRLSPDLGKQLKQLKKKDPKLLAKVEKQLKIFSQKPKHGSLRLHKLSGSLENMWSIAVSRSYRLVFLIDGGEAYFVDFGTHDEVYRKK